MELKQLKIDPEFKDAIQPLAPEELAQLESNIKGNGCRDPLVTWNDFIIDGHLGFLRPETPRNF